MSNKKAQSVSGEYALLIVLVSLVIGGMVVYVQRTLQGRMRDASMFAVAQANAVLGKEVLIEYEPYYVDTEGTSMHSGSSEQKVIGDSKYQYTTVSQGQSTMKSVQLPY